MQKNKTLIFDIESTNLAANYGYILCISYKWLEEKEVHTISIDDFSRFKQDPTNDKDVVNKFGDIYNKADLTVAHYGQKFDLPMINTRRLMHNLAPLPPTKLKDTWRISKDKLRLNSNRLDTLIHALGVKIHKTPLSGPIWIKAMAGNRAAISYVKQHCVNDVKALGECYIRLFPLQTENMNPIFHKCDPKFMRKHGLRVCDKKTFQRLYCIKCSGWFKGDVIP